MVGLTIRTWHWLMVVAELGSIAIYIASLGILTQYFGEAVWRCLPLWLVQQPERALWAVLGTHQYIRIDWVVIAPPNMSTLLPHIHFHTFPLLSTSSLLPTLPNSPSFLPTPPSTPTPTLSTSLPPAHLSLPPTPHPTPSSPTLFLDPQFLLTFGFAWKTLLVTCLSCLPLVIMKVVHRRCAPPSYSKLARKNSMFRNCKFWKCRV